MKRLPPATRVAPVVQGPIKCHKCQAKCPDAAAYLKHVCETTALPDDATIRRLVLHHAISG